ncbi:hypothetical protein BKA65DRAFT_444264 [Rhexocercosporidium sp. MPI-PUGE-AT-0058]|nr:hypothetical protein BKA65DRAFT_444264 [Rhexocercosporidium sp. MPI-PUGE-AT-0058]
MQSCLYFLRSGRHSLQYAKPLPGFPNKLLSPRCKATTTSRSIHKARARVQPVVEGEDGTDPGSSARWRKIHALDKHTTSATHTTKGRSVLARHPSDDALLRGPEASSLRSLTPHRGTSRIKRKRHSLGLLAIRRPIKLRNRQPPKSYSSRITLAKYLDLGDVVEKQAYWREVRESLPSNSLPTIVLHQLYINSISKGDWDHHDHTFRNNAATYLTGRNLDVKDVERWAWILSGETTDQTVKRLVSVSSDYPMFLLLEVLRKDIRHIGNFKNLLLHAWDHVEKKCLQKPSSTEPLAITPRFEQMQDNELASLVSRLLYQARRVWPAAMVSVANMVPLYVQHLRDRSSQDLLEQHQRIYKRSCDLLNYVLPLLALPMSIDPLKSMVHNWSAQKVLLNLAGKYDPPLMLEKNSYRAVIQVLTASKKTDRESKAALLRLRSWPPWRTEQDGMDAQRAPEDDLSRSLLASVRSKEAGFREAPYDQRLRILGGQELDGTPTIHTRKLVKWRSPLSPNCGEALIESTKDAHGLLHHSFDPNIWAARVEATRDVREAWRAFVSFKDRGGKPNQTLYLAMFQKLNFEQARQGRRSAHEAAPGDGNEVLPVPDDNMSDFFKSHSQPPSLGALYKQMLSSGIRPSGQCLVFLVRHAKTSTKGINYLRDSGLHPLALQYLTGGQDSSISPSQKPSREILDTFSDTLFGAFIHLICRFAPRAVLTSSDEFSRYKLKPVQLKEPLPAQWAIQEFERTPYYRLRDPLRQASRLLKNEKVKFRPAWYSLFKGLARRNIVLRLALIGDPQNDALAWRFTMSVLRNFHECGLELDPYGFMLICTTFFKFAEATHHVSEGHRVDLAAGAQLLKDEFAKLCHSEALPYTKPTLLHTMRWVTLHIYVRCMGIVGDCEEVIAVLEWMVQHREELEECNSQDRNAQEMLTRTLIAARISCYETKHEDRAMELVKQVDTWTWPDDSSVALYTGALDSDSGDDAEEGENLDAEDGR